MTLSPQMEEAVRARATIITRKLMVNGFGQVAVRLVLHAADGSDLGGWGEHAIFDVVQPHVRSLVLQAQGETAERCCEIIHEVAIRERGDSLVDVTIRATIAKEFALGSGDDGEGKG